MKCCASCFGDRGLQAEIHYMASEEGTCEYCNALSEKLILPRELRKRFWTVVDIYERDDSGELLVHWLKQDWDLFPQLDEANAQRLLLDILDDEDAATKCYNPYESYASDRSNEWKEFREELKHSNRFFPKTSIDFDRLEILLDSLVLMSIDLSSTWYRARIQPGDEILGPEDMEAPPREIAPHGRANPAGIPYFYLGSTIETAISEIRPNTGEIASVADVTIPVDLRTIDLRSPRTTVSPFLPTEEDVGQMRVDLTFLELLGEELSRPVRPQAAPFDYTPSQYLCEFIKKCGYDGVVYTSSVSEGFNLAIFQPERAKIGDISQHEVTKVSVIVKPFK